MPPGSVVAKWQDLSSESKTGTESKAEQGHVNYCSKLHLHTICSKIH